MHKLRFSVLVLLGLGLPAWACDDAAEDASRVVIAGGSLTEIAYELGIEHRVVGVDRTSNYPPAATELPSIGYVRTLSAEGLLSLDPTLLMGEHDMGPDEVVTQVANAGLQVVRVAQSLTAADIRAKVDCVATVMGAPTAAADALAARLAGQADALNQVQTDRAPRVAVLLTLGEAGPVGGGADTSAQNMLDMVGAQNVFGGFEGWKPISLEAMARSNPEYLVLTQRAVDGAGGIDKVLSHPGIRLTDAGRSQALIVFDGMSLLGFGPRTLATAVDLAMQLGTLPSAEG